MLATRFWFVFGKLIHNMFSSKKFVRIWLELNVHSIDFVLTVKSATSENAAYINSVIQYTNA